MIKRCLKALLCLCLLVCCFAGCGKADAAETKTYEKEGVYVGQIPMAQYAIGYASGAAKTACEELQTYLRRMGVEVPVLSAGKVEEHGIVLKIDKTMEETEGSISAKDGLISISGGSREELLKQTYLFINQYLGWKDAGTKEAHMTTTASVVRVPWQIEVKTPWMEEREAIVTLWNVNYARGTYLDSDVSLKNNLIDYSSDQLYEYVKMLKYCGFTGIQVTEMVSTWAGVGSYEASHEKIRMLADAAHALDMKFTLWVWGAEFADNSWVDDEVTYRYAEGGYTFDNPDVVAAFEKYYDIYAQLADCCDRVIGHYYDPGNVYTAQEIGYYAKMLKDKFHAVNPDIDFGVSCWVDVYDKNVIVEAIGTDVTLYERGQRDEENTYGIFRNEINSLGVRLGTWAWNTCEMEIDQLAQMNFNMEIIRRVYQTARKYDEIAKPSYWSEMDSYHVLNAFSLFCAGQLLIDPDMESDELYKMISMAAVGPEYADAFSEMLSIIQDARSGYSWDTFFWSNENYILKSDAYDAKSILERCEKVLPVLQEMIEDGVDSYTMPFPIELKDVLRMMQPHLVQIRDYAKFRLGLAELEADFAAGTEKQELQEKINKISEPIKNYNCVIGSWGQIEARAQYEMVTEFCARAGLEVPRHATFDNERKQRILAQLRTFQKELDEPYKQSAPYYQFDLAFGEEETARLVQELVEEGLLIRAEDGSVYLADWEKYLYHFDA